MEGGSEQPNGAGTVTTTTSTTPDGKEMITEDLGQGVLIHSCPTFLAPDEAAALFEHVMTSVTWEHSERTLSDGSTYKLPRVQAWMSTEYKKVGTLYQKNPPTVWTPPVLKVKAAIEAALGNRCTFDYVLINLYRNGDDSIGFHADDEARGVNPTNGPKNIVASVSLGATRTFVLRHGRKKKLPPRHYALTSGSLLIMDGTTQTHWRHAVPREEEVKEPRINLTFRVS